MAYGLQILRDDGSLWISPDVSPLNYMGRVAFGGVGQLTTNVPSAKSLMVFIRNDAPQAATRVTLNNSGATWTINITQTNSTGSVYLFSNTVLSQHGIGVAVYNAAGEMVWNSDMLPLQTFRVYNPYGIDQNGQYSIDTGVQLAVAPGICSTYLAILNGPESIFLWGEISAGANGTTIYGVRTSGVQVNGEQKRWKYKEVFLCIDVSKYQ